MHRGSHHYGVPFDSAYSRRGGYQNSQDNMIEIVQQFREFKPYLKKRLAYIRESGRSLELQEEIEDIEFYLEVMKDILADESHGVDQLKSFIDKIHEMIRKNPLTDLPGKRHSLDAEDEFGDNDRPRSPSPETRGSDSTTNIPLIPTHGAHRTVDVNFTPRNDRHKHLKTEETFNEWGRPNFENSFTRRDPYNKDVDMRGGFYNNNPTGAMGRGQRRWSEEGGGGGNEYVGGARGLGRGMGIGRAAPNPHHRQDLDNRNSRGRGYNDNDYERRSDLYSDRRDSSKERERDLKPEWLTGGPSNGNKFDEWQPKREPRDNCFGTDMERRSREDGWRKSHSETRERDEQMHNAQQHIAKYFERRPSSETRREERTDDYNPMFDRRPRNDRPHDPTNMRHDMNSSHPDYSHGRHGGHGDFHGRGRNDDDRHDMRSRFEGGPPHYPPPATAPPLMNPMTSIPPPQPPSMAYGVQQPQSHFNNAPGLLGPPPSPFTSVNPPLLPLPIPNAPPMGMGLGMPNVPPQMSPGGHPMNFQQPPPSPNFPLSEMHPNPPYRMPPPHSQPRPPHPPPGPMRHPAPNHPSEHYTRPPAPNHPSEHYTRPPTPNHSSEQYTRPPASNHPPEQYTRPPASNHPPEHYTGPPTPNHSSEHYPGVPSSSPNYASPVEPSADQVREITMMKAKQCFGRVVSRSPSGTSTQATAGPSPSNTISVPPGLSSPNRMCLGGDSPNNIPLDPRLNRGRPGNNHTVQSRQQSPPAAPSSRSNSTSSRPADAGNVLRPSADPRARSRVEQERRKFQENKDRIRQQEGSSSSKSNSNKGSKIQELRKQFEKEGFHRLGRPGPKKPCGSFEDAITPRVDEEADISNTAKSGDKNRSSSSSSSHSKDRDSESDRQSRSHTDKTERSEREKSPKKNKGGDKHKSKEKANKSAEKAEKKKDKESTKERTSPRKKQGQNDKEKAAEKGSSQSPKASRSTGSTESLDLREKTPDPTKPPSFKIPRKPKPKEPEPEKPSNVEESSPESQEKDVCTSPPASPEPALSQVPDVENRIEIVDEMPASSSTSSTTQETSESSDVNPNALEYLKQFLMTSADPDDREFILANPENLKQFFFKIKSEFIAAKGKQSEESSSSTTNDDKSQPPEEDVPERGRSREKKKNAKRRSSLEKLHDALKEMRFDTMLPLGPRRCTVGRGAQEEVVPESVEPESTAVPPEETEEVKAAETPEKKDDDAEKANTVRKRGRPPKDSPKGKKAVSKATQEEEEEVVQDQTEEPESVVEVVPEDKPSPAPKRGTKRKLKPVKAKPRKRTKKSGPITRAQVAAMKKGKDGSKAKPEESAEKAEGVTTRNKNKANNVILRRLTRRRVCANDTMVNKGLCKIKLESDFAPSVKTEPTEVDPFLNTSSAGVNDELEDQLENIINENLDAILDKQTEDNMDLDVFNTLDADDNAGEVCVKDEMEISFTNPPSGDISFEGIMSGPSPVTPKRCTKAKTLVPPPTPSDKDSSEASATTSASLENDTSPKVSNNSTSALPSQSTNVDKTITTDLSATTSKSATGTENEVNSVDTVVAPQVTEDISVSNAKTGGHVAKSNSPKKSNDTAPIFSPDEDDSSSLPSTSSSSSVTPVIKTEAHEDDLKIKAETLDTSSELPGIDELRKDVFSNKCDKCNFSGKKIVAHYVNKHYPCNIPQARLMPETFNGLIELNTSESPQLLEIVLDESQTPVWPCLYCDDRYNCIVDFYDHLTSHTGEFRYECGECGTSYPYHKSLVNHVKSHKGVSKNFIRFTFESVIEKKSRDLSGFLCNDCFYFQLRFESIIRHIEQTGHSSFDVKSVRLIRPSANHSADSTADNSNATVKVPKLPSESIKEKMFNEGSPKSAIANADQYNFKSKSSSPTKQESVNDKDSDCVFFGTNANYVPPRMPPMDCPISIARVFNESFLENIIRKCALKREEDEERNRKRKRSEEDGKDGNEEKRTVKLRTTISRRRTNLEWDAESDESLVEEPNNFLLSSDDETNESELSDHSEDDYNTKRRRKDKHGSPHGRKVEGLQNNEHIIKTKQKRKIESWDKRYFSKHDLVTIRRPGDLYCPTTVIFGYVRAGIPKTATHKLRDQKELDKLSPCNGARILAVKCAPKLKEMICDEKLKHLFKCMSSVCSYTTDVAADFISHLNMNHYTNGMLSREQSCSRFLPVRDIVMMKDSDCCAYCAARYREAKDLVEHIINQHAKSIYSCTKCFYRSFYHRYVIKHFEDEHPDEEEINVLKCHTQVESTSEEATLFQIFVYKCDIENPACDKSKRFVFREDFTEHLQECAPIGHELYPCHLCKSSYPLDRLIEHYKTHNLFKFHCSYCTFGSEVKADLDDHFVALHPNTSGRVFYRVKPSASSPIKPPIFPESLKTEKRKKPPSDKTAAEAKKAAEEGAQMESQVNNENQDASESEDNEKGRVTNLKGRDLYRCVTGSCDFIAEDGDTFKEHVNSCTFVAESRSLSCAHCERKMKTATNLLEHMRVHGEKKHVCCLCNFRCWTSAEITKHIKTVHRVLSHKLLKEEVDPTDPDPDILAYPKEVVTKNLITCDSLDNNYYSFAKKAVFSFDNINKLPLNKVFSAHLHCAMCPYATKVRSNMVRHLNIHNQAFHDGKTVVPQAQRINPVPYLSREGLEFDKMMNLAASSHKSEGAAATEDVKKLPRFVKEQFRYVCSVCDHITSDENLLQTHIKVIHSEVNVYKCPHCQKIPETKSNPDNIVPLDKIAFHLRLHGPKLYKCGHCMVAHHQLRLMEKHIPDKHPEKKPIHYLVRDVDPDGIPSARPTAFGLNRRHSIDDTKTEKWRCYLCSSKTIFPSWDETKAHCISVHKMGYQLMCLMCGFVADEVVDMLTHCSTDCKDEDTKKKVLVMFSRCESTDGDDSNVAPVWRKSNGPIRHIHGNFTEDSMALIKQYSTQLPSEPLPTSSSSLSPLRGSTTPPTIKTTIKPGPAITSKARRSIGGSTPTKASPVKTSTTTPAMPPPQKAEKQEVFKYRCHKCDMYRTKNPGELRIHLFNEFRYKRWMCLVCTTKFTTEKSLKGHIERDHQKVYDQVFYELQPENIEIEGEIDECIEKQNRKREMINSFSVEKNGKLSCKHCKEDGYTYDTFETHILQKHSS